MAFNEKPPMLTGNQQSDMVRMRDYLFRLANSLDAIASAPAVYTGTSNPALTGSGSGSNNSEAIALVRKSAQELRDLIIQNADLVASRSQAYTDGKITDLTNTYVAQSDFGTYKEEVSARFITNEQNISEAYTRSEEISSQVGDFFTQMNGEIRRGFIENPDYYSGSSVDEFIFGIAISSDLKFKAEIPKSDGTYEYYHLEKGQTFGFYTSSGWQFWVEGEKRGYYDSIDQKLHVRDIVADDSLQIGSDWQIRAYAASQELEFVYVGQEGGA